MENSHRYRATEALSMALQEQGRTSAWLARKLGVHRSLVTHITKGRRTVDRLTGERVSELIQVPFFVLWELSIDANIASSELQEVAA